MRRALFLIFVGLGGAIVLLALGIWQMQRLAEKEGFIADIEARIAAPFAYLPEDPDPEGDAYLPVIAAGTLEPKFLRILVSQKEIGAGYRIIAPLTVENGRAVLVDLGVIPADRREFTLNSIPITVTGHLQWPNEVDRFTPDPDIRNNIWFARDVPAMARKLNTQPVLIVATTVEPDISGVSPLPVDTSRIPNNHLQYAITWFSLAALWLAMTVFFVLRGRSTPAER